MKKVRRGKISMRSLVFVINYQYGHIRTHTDSLHSLESKTRFSLESDSMIRIIIYHDRSAVDTNRLFKWEARKLEINPTNHRRRKRRLKRFENLVYSYIRIFPFLKIKSPVARKKLKNYPRYIHFLFIIHHEFKKKMGLETRGRW